MPLEKWDPDTDFLIGSWTIGRTPKHPNAVIGKQTSDALTVAYWSGVAHESEPEATAAGWSVVLALAHRSVCIIGWQTAACRTKRPSLSHHANSRHSGRLIVAAAGRYAVDRPPRRRPVSYTVLVLVGLETATILLLTKVDTRIGFLGNRHL